LRAQEENQDEDSERDRIPIGRGEIADDHDFRGSDEQASEHRARDVATFRRCLLKRNSIPCGASSGLEVAIE